MDASNPRLVLGFAGAQEEVADQLQRAAELGISRPSSLEHEKEFWAGDPALPVRFLSVLPSRLTEWIPPLGGIPWIARAGNGLICYRGGPEPPKTDLPVALMRRVKDTFDPRHILPELLM